MRNRSADRIHAGSAACPCDARRPRLNRARGGAMDIRETDLWSPTRVVIIEFPDVKSAQAFVDSEEYAPVKPLRRQNADCTLFILEGD